MKVEWHTIPRMSLGGFAEKHDLTLEIHERPPGLNLWQYWASFVGVEVMDNGILSSVAGNGDTPAQAAAYYARKISGTRIAVNAYSDKRVEIDVPLLYYNNELGSYIPGEATTRDGQECAARDHQ